MNEISVCLIVKNEQQVLERCLKCVEKFADEIIVVDTGSTDKTIEIAKAHTKNVFNFEWQNDFALARNFSFSKATCPFIMWIDADDVVPNSEIKKINQLKKGKMDADVYMLKYAISFDENNNPTFSYFRERILRASKNFVWQGFVHEVIVPCGKIEHLNITIEHRKEHKSNPKRNLKIYNEKIKQGEILNPRQQFYYARELFYNEKFKKCIKVLKNYLKNNNLFLPNKLDAHKTIAQCLLKLGNKTEAFNWLVESLKFSQPSAEICCLLGEIKVEENLTQAKFWFESALNCKQDFESGAFIQEDYYNFIPFMQLCYVNFKLGNFQQAKLFHEKAKKLHPKNESVVYNDMFFKNCKNFNKV